MNRTFFLLALAFNLHLANVNAQLTLEACQEKARLNYPLIKQYGLIEEAEGYNLSNASKGYLPQISLSAKVTYQSEVTEIPVSMPGVEGLNKGQYQAVAEVNQILWDGGVIEAQKKLTKTSTEVDKQKTEVDLFALRDRVNQLFFGILSVRELLIQNEILQQELQTNYEKINAWMQNGIANASDLDAVRVEQLKTGQRRTELTATENAYREMLSAMIADSIGEATLFIKPGGEIPVYSSLSINRPELELFEAQHDFYTSQENTVKSGNRPKIGLFVQGGFGNPGLNMLEKGFSPFYIAGTRLSWNLGGLYTQKNNLRKIGISQQSVNVQEETFLYNTRLKVTQQNHEMNKILEQLKSDDEIISLRNRIKKSAEAKVENGTLSVSDLIREIHAEDLARQDKALHEIQLLLSIYNLKNITNH